jgi:hypothetical protein
VLCLDILVEAILSREIVEIGENFLGACIHGGPIELRLKRPCVIVRRNIACASNRERVSLDNSIDLRGRVEEASKSPH